MTSEEIQKLKANLAAAEAAAKAADDDLAANPDDPSKIAAKTSADANLEIARNAVADAEVADLKRKDTSDQIQEYKGRVILLTVYLLAIVVLSIYLLAGFFMAETDPVTVDKRRGEDRCCNSNSNTNSSRSTSPTPNANPANANRANANSAAPNNNANAVNSNANAASTAAANGSVPTDGAASGGSDSAAGSNSSNLDNPNGATPSPVPDFSVPEISIPKEVYVRFPGFSTGDVWSAESYLFLVVFFAGMLGGTIRALHSLVKHIGLKDFSFYWSWFYITLPLSGGGLAVVIYFVMRGGFYGGGFGKGLVINIFSFAALGALTGLFTDNAMEKLKQVADTLLAPVPPKVDS